MAEVKKAKSIQATFDQFDIEHPEVYRLFKKFAKQLFAAGRRRGSADALLHRVRWEFDVNPDHDAGFKLNNNFSSRYARKLIGEAPHFSGFFETRKLRRG